MLHPGLDETLETAAKILDRGPKRTGCEAPGFAEEMQIEDLTDEQALVCAFLKPVANCATNRDEQVEHRPATRAAREEKTNMHHDSVQTGSERTVDDDVKTECEVTTSRTILALLLAFVIFEASFLAVVDPSRHPVASLVGEASSLCGGAFATVLVISSIVLRLCDASAPKD